MWDYLSPEGRQKLIECYCYHGKKARPTEAERAQAPADPTDGQRAGRFAASGSGGRQLPMDAMRSRSLTESARHEA